MFCAIWCKSLILIMLYVVFGCCASLCRVYEGYVAVWVCDFLNFFKYFDQTNLVWKSVFEQPEKTGIITIGCCSAIPPLEGGTLRDELNYFFLKKTFLSCSFLLNCDFLKNIYLEVISKCAPIRTEYHMLTAKPGRNCLINVMASLVEQTTIQLAAVRVAALTLSPLCFNLIFSPSTRW